MQVITKGVYMGVPQDIGPRPDGSSWISAINKTLVRTGLVWVGHTALAGDQQVETRPLEDKDGRTHRQVHGGRHKAVYVLPTTSCQVWSSELNRVIDAGYMGANLEVEGIDEGSACIGDTWLWGDAVLEVTGVRTPCKTLVQHTGVQDIMRRMYANGCCGWYLGVLEPGWAPTAGEIQVVQRGTGPTIADKFSRKKTEKGSRAVQLPFAPAN